MTSPIRNDRPSAPPLPTTAPAEPTPPAAAPVAAEPARGPARPPGYSPASAYQPPAPVTTGRTADLERDAALRSLTTATRGLREAQGRRETADQELGRSLMRHGEAMTPEQRQTYADNYRRDHADVYEAERRSTAEVNRVFQEQGPALERAAANPVTARPLAEGLSALAATPDAATAVDFTTRVLGGSNPEAAAHLRAQPNLERDVYERGIPNAIVAAATRNPDNLRAGAEEAARIAAPLVTMGVQGMRAFTEGTSLANGQMDSVANFANRFRDAPMAIRGLTIGGAALNLVMGGSHASEGRITEAAEALARGGQGGMEVLSGAINSGALGMRVAASGARVATMAARMAPALGVLANSASLAHNASQAIRTGNAGNAVAAVGDILATAGSAAASFPPTAVPGFLVGAAGTGISAGGELLAQRIESRRDREAELRRLQDAGVPPRAARQMLDNPEGMRVMRQTGRTAEQVQELAAQPQSASFLARPEELRRTSELLGRLGATSAQHDQLVRRFSGPELSALTMGLNPPRGPLAPAQAREYLDQVGRRSGFSDGARQALRELVAQLP